MEKQFLINQFKLDKHLLFLIKDYAFESMISRDKLRRYKERNLSYLHERINTKTHVFEMGERDEIIEMPIMFYLKIDNDYDKMTTHMNTSWLEVEEEIVIDPYLEEIELLRNNLERVSLSIPEETDLTKVFQDIQILRNRIDNIPNQKDYSGDIESIREELVRIEGSIPLPEVFDASDLYENISEL